MISNVWNSACFEILNSWETLSILEFCIRLSNSLGDVWSLQGDTYDITNMTSLMTSLGSNSRDSDWKFWKVKRWNSKRFLKVWGSRSEVGHQGLRHRFVMASLLDFGGRQEAIQSRDAHTSTGHIRVVESVATLLCASLRSTLHAHRELLNTFRIYSDLFWSLAKLLIAFLQWSSFLSEADSYALISIYFDCLDILRLFVWLLLHFGSSAEFSPKHISACTHPLVTQKG